MRSHVTFLGLATLWLWLAGCQAGPGWQVRQAQLRTMQAIRQNHALSAQMSGYQMQQQQLASSLELANQRIANLNAERAQLHSQYEHLLTGLPAPGNSPLSSALTQQLAELSRRYPQFEFDPATGVSRFNDDLLFASGSDEIRDGGFQVLKEFARIMNQPEAQPFQILVVGHTDDKPVVLPTTRARHETNWELSAHRATRVVRFLATEGLAEPRMGIAGYNQYQPHAPNNSDANRQQNRRAEIYILAPDARIAGREVDRQ